MTVCKSSLCLKRQSVLSCSLSRVAVILLAVAGLSSCGSKEKEAGQSLVKVNGQEITVHQVNEELKRGNVPVEQKDAATKQLLETLIDQQLLQGEAARDKVDRDPAVMQTIERAKSQIMAQAYLQKRLANTEKPTKEEIEAYFVAHPEIFSQRKTLDMSQVVIATSDFGDDLKAMLGSAKTLDEIVAWLDGRKVAYVRSQTLRSTADIPPELTKKLQGMRKGQMFALQEGDRSVLLMINDIKDSPVTAAIATPQIGQFLLNQKTKVAAEAELARLRAAAKIEYLNQPKTVDAKEKAVAPTPAAAPMPAVAPVQPAVKSADDSHLKRGVAGL